jgi:SET domain-containing protein
MLLVPVRIGPSEIHGLGVFSVERIVEGTVVWCFTPGFDLDCDPRIVDEQPEPLRRVLLHYGYVDARLDRYVLCCDDARLLNHCETPNLVSDYSVEPHGQDVAVRDIEPGEELTVDYGTIEASRSVAGAKS